MYIYIYIYTYILMYKYMYTYTYLNVYILYLYTHIHVIYVYILPMYSEVLYYENNFDKPIWTSLKTLDGWTRWIKTRTGKRLTNVQMEGPADRWKTELKSWHGWIKMDQNGSKWIKMDQMEGPTNLGFWASQWICNYASETGQQNVDSFIWNDQCSKPLLVDYSGLYYPIYWLVYRDLPLGFLVYHGADVLPFLGMCS